MTRTARKAILALAWIVAVACPVFAQEAALDTLVDLAVQDAPLAAVAAQLSRQSGAKVVAQPAVADIKVSLDVHAVSLRLALEMLAEVTGVSVGVVGDQIVMRRASDAAEAGFKPLATLAGPLRRDAVKKVVYHCQQTLPSQLAAYFGRPAVKHTGPGGGLEQPTPVRYTIAQTSLARRENETPDQTARLDKLLGQEAGRTTQRWADLASGVTPHPGCRGAIALPAGTAVVIGYDPSRTLIAVGEPAAVDRFAQLAKELDVAAGRIELNARYFVMPADRFAALSLKWNTAPAESGNANLRCAIGGLDTLSAELAKAAVTQIFDAKPVTVDVARPAVLTCSRQIVPPLRAIEGCAATPLVAADVASALVTTDLKVVPWPVVGDGQRWVRLHLEPTFGDALLELKTGAAGSIAKSSMVPCSCSTITVPLGQSLVVSGVLPRGTFRAPDSCRLLANLPLSGDLYRTTSDPATEMVVAVVLTPAMR
ncbi:MAG: hypothetical protein HZB16_13185 [Armatimonadetes bacterium]|nr:hypothetical protein [Armatimonadota bacterium]